jgi:hypothetical protein
MHLHRVGSCGGKAHTEKVPFWLHLLGKQKVEKLIEGDLFFRQGKRTNHKMLYKIHRIIKATEKQEIET